MPDPILRPKRKMNNLEPSYRTSDPIKTLKRLRLIAILEGISFLVLLFVAMPIKYLAGNPQPVQLVGMLHGWLFILYCLLLALAHHQCKWTWGKTALGFLLSLIPFGTFYAEKKMFR